MEKVSDFDEWISDYSPIHIKYVATFNPDTGSVIAVGPSHAFPDEINKIPIDKELAESIINSEIKISSCVVDINSNTIEVAEIKSIFKIDDVLHRIVDKKYSQNIKSDVHLTHNIDRKILKIELSKEFGGTKRNALNLKQRKIIWHGDTQMNFYITDYNDPNIMYEVISFKISDLLDNSQIIKNFNYTNYSIYTRRLFKNYMIEKK